MIGIAYYLKLIQHNTNDMYCQLFEMQHNNTNDMYCQLFEINAT